MAPQESIRLRTAKTFLITMGDPSQHSTFSALLSSTYTQTLAPSTIPLGPFTKPQILARMASLEPIMHRLVPTIINIIESEADNSVWIHSSAVPEWKEEARRGGGEEWDAHGEYVFMIWMTEDGRGVERCAEFLQEAHLEKVTGLVERALENVGMGKEE